MTEIKRTRTSILIHEILYANLENRWKVHNSDLITEAIYNFLDKPDFSSLKMEHSGKTVETQYLMPDFLKNELEKFFPKKSAIINKALEMYFYPQRYPDPNLKIE